MPQKTNPPSRLADAALRILAKKAWRDISLAEIARAAKVPMSDVAAIVPAKPALLGLILRRFGDTVAKTYKPDRDAESGRDRLFDVGMAWFDAMTPHRAAIHALYAGFRNDPLTVLTVRSDIVAAAEWLMTLAEADKGPALSLRAVGFATVLGRAISVWLDDDSDLTKTMARLDGDLRRGESWLGKL
jgi:AcrR family transcriptional regulator